jgi:transcriptional regulator with XRE-family HTH domain
MGAKPQDATGHNSPAGASGRGYPREYPRQYLGDAIFAQRLGEIRARAGLTQQQIADRMAAAGHAMVHRSTIGKIENGDRPVTIGEAIALTTVLGVPLAALVTGQEADADLWLRAQLMRSIVERDKMRVQEREEQLRQAKAEADKHEKQLRELLGMLGEEEMS